MLVSQKHAALVERLYTLTDQRKLEWGEEGWDSEYCAKVGEWSVGIANGRKNGRPVIIIKLYNSSGAEIDSFDDEDLGSIVPTVTQHESYYPVMADLLTFAKRAATGADQAIDSILDALGDSDN